MILLIFLIQGLKFAMTEIKLALTKILYRYDINSCSQTKDVLELKEGFPMRKPKYGVPVLLTKRMNTNEFSPVA